MFYKIKPSVLATFFTLFISLSGIIAQNYPLNELVEYSASKNQQSVFQPFSISANLNAANEIQQYVTSATVLDLNSASLKEWRLNKPPFVELSIPMRNGGAMILDLVEYSPLNENFTLVTSADPKKPVPYKGGLYYRGVVRGQPASMVAVSVFGDDVMGIVSTAQDGNMVLGRMDAESVTPTSQQYVFYREQEMKESNPYICGTDNLPDYSEDLQEIISSDGEVCKTISVYIEGDNLLYKDKGRSVAKTTDYITGLFNVVAVLYSKEEITTNIKKIKVWTTTDPYNKSSSGTALRQFGARIKDNFDGDIAHLFSRSRNNLGGVAWINILCRKFVPSTNFGRFAFSNIFNSYRSFPTYSWSVQVVSHEMGHNLGSPHTHNCSWGPSRNQALDNCAAPEGNCKRGPVPVGGGTTMSYCHLSSRGINFTKGFGDEPGNLIRLRVARANCLGGAFSAQITPKENQLVYYGDSMTLSATPTGAKYSYQWYKNNTEIPGATAAKITVSENGTYLAEIKTTCSVFSNEVEVTNREFIASIHYPAVGGARDSVGFTFFDTITSQEKDTVFFNLPDDVLSNLPPTSINHFVRLTSVLEGGFPTQLNLLKMGVFAPAGTGVSFPSYNPSAQENVFRKKKTYFLDMGTFNPGGKWTFIFSNNNTIDRKKPIKMKFLLELIAIDQGHASQENLALCNVTDFVLDPNLPNANYLWSTGETTETITINENGIYSVTVTKGSLTSEDDIEITEVPTDFDVSTSICANEIMTFGSQQLTESGIYTDTFTTAMGCDSIVTLQLTVMPEIIDSIEVMACYGEKYQGEAQFKDTTLRIILKAANGCDSINIVDLTVTPEIAFETELVPACQNLGSTVNIIPLNGENYTIVWDDSITGYERKNIKRKSIKVTLKNDSECEITETITLEHFDSISVTSQVKDVLCFNSEDGAIDITPKSGSEPFVYVWNDGDYISSRTDLKPGNYELTISDTNECVWTGSFVVGAPDQLSAQFDVKDASSSNNDGRIEIAVSGGVAPYKILWEDNSTDLIKDTLAAGTYIIIVSDANGCEQSFEVEVKLNTSTTNIVGLSTFELFPNPVSNLLTIRVAFDRPMSYEWVLQTIDGHNISREALYQQKKYVAQLDTKSLPNGIYLVKIVTNEGIAVKKLIINH